MESEEHIKEEVNKLLNLNPNIAKPVGAFVVAIAPGHDLILAFSLQESEPEPDTESSEAGLHFYRFPPSQVVKLIEDLQKMLRILNKS